MIAIAAGTTLYAYVAGFIGNSTQNSGFNQEYISIDAACVSTSSNCNGKGYYAVIRNLGNTLSYNSGTIQVYFTDSATSASGSTTFAAPSSISNGGSVTISGSLNGFTTSQGDNVVIKIVMPNGGSASYSVRVIG